MGWFEALVLGLVQGLTEFLPISSSAHVRIVAALAGWGDPGAAFTAVTQIGTELAVILYFGPKIGRILRAWFFSLYRPDWRRDPDARLGWLIIVGSLPIVVLGLLLQVTGLITDLAIGSAAGLFRDAVLGRRKVRLALDGAAGTVYGALAVLLVLGVARE